MEKQTVLCLDGLYQWILYFSRFGPYPVFDPYQNPHIAKELSFLLGHYCLLINSLIYLLRWYDRNLLKNSQIVLYTFALDLLIEEINQLTRDEIGA